MPEPEAVIDPSELSQYLASRGWRREGNWRGAGVWELDSSGRLLIPDHREYQDDAELLAEAVRKLAAYEERPEQELLLDISEPMVDSQYFRTHPDTPSGTTPLPSGIRALNGVHLLMATAARTVEEGPRMLFEGRRSGPVDAFLHRISLGTARPGSYILTTRVPVAAPSTPQLSLWGYATVSQKSQAISGRAVLSRLRGAIEVARVTAERVAARRLAGERDQLDLFDDCVEQDVSANLCKALADLGGFSKDRPFEVGFTWARGLPDRQAGGPIAFTGPMAGILAQAGDELERLAKTGRARITGTVETLNMRVGEEPKIKVVGEFQSGGRDSYRRALWVIVSSAQYDQAIEAQRAGLHIDVVGRLVNVHRRRELRPERFDIITW